MADGYTREALILKLVQDIAGAENKDIARANRDYTLDLVRDVVAAVDGNRRMQTKIAPGQG